jgi:hypothetical protein
MRTVIISNFIRDPILCYNGYPSPTAQGGMRVVVEPSSTHVGNVPDSCTKLFAKPNPESSKISRTPRQEIPLSQPESEHAAQLQVTSFWDIYGRVSFIIALSILILSKGHEKHSGNKFELFFWPTQADDLAAYPSELMDVIPRHLLAKRTLSVQNLTKDAVFITCPDESDSRTRIDRWFLVVKPSSSRAHNLPDSYHYDTIWIDSFDSDRSHPETASVSLSGIFLPYKKSWRTVTAPDHYHVRIYGIRVSLKSLSFICQVDVPERHRNRITKY